MITHKYQRGSSHRAAVGENINHNMRINISEAERDASISRVSERVGHRKGEDKQKEKWGWFVQTGGEGNDRCACPWPEMDQTPRSRGLRQPPCENRAKVVKCVSPLSVLVRNPFYTSPRVIYRSGEWMDPEKRSSRAAQAEHVQASDPVSK